LAEMTKSNLKSETSRKTATEEEIRKKQELRRNRSDTTWNGTSGEHLSEIRSKS